MTSRKHKQKRTLHFCKVLLGAANQIRTGDLVLTKDVLCLLSHSSKPITVIYYTLSLPLCQALFTTFLLYSLIIIVICLNTWVVIIICVHKIVLLALVFVLYHSAQIDVINALEIRKMIKELSKTENNLFLKEMYICERN